MEPKVALLKPTNSNELLSLELTSKLCCINHDNYFEFHDKLVQSAKHIYFQ
jgi:hypothetical protein